MRHLCKAAMISPSGFYKNRISSINKIKRDEQPLRIIRDIFEKSKCKDGIRTIKMKLRRAGNSMNHKKIARLKKENGLVTKIRRKSKFGPFANKTFEHHTLPNILKRDFIKPLHNMAWVTDTSVIVYESNLKIYLSAIKDLGTNEIISYRVLRNQSVQSYINELQSLLKELDPAIKGRLIIHSDQGVQYTNKAYVDFLKLEGVIQSMSRKANCHDNAPIESFFGHLKDNLELKRGASFIEVKKEIDRAIDYYNNERPQVVLKGLTPIEYRGHLSSEF